MGDMHGIEITTRDRVLRGWENSTELVREYENYYNIIEDDKEVANLFAEFAETEAKHASKLLEILRKYEEKNSKKEPRF